MTSNRERLLSLIRERAYVAGQVTLASGQTSDFYIDGKMIEVSPEGAYLIGEVLFEEIDQLDVDAVGGQAVGAVPLVTSVVISCHHHGRAIEGFFVRESAKSHGTMKVVEGRLPDAARVVLVEDVVTSGKSVMKAVEAVEGRGAQVVCILAIVDREAGGADFFKSKGYNFRSIFTKSDVLAHTSAT